VGEGVLGNKLLSSSQSCGTKSCINSEYRQRGDQPGGLRLKTLLLNVAFDQSWAGDRMPVWEYGCMTIAAGSDLVEIHLADEGKHGG